MALLQDFLLIDNFGKEISFDRTYVKVTHVTSTKTTGALCYKIFEKQEGRCLADRSVDFPIDLDGPNPIKQAYLHLKTLPEFADAIDC